MGEKIFKVQYCDTVYILRDFINKNGLQSEDISLIQPKEQGYLLMYFQV